MREKARRVKFAGSAHWWGGEGVLDALGCAQRTRAQEERIYVEERAFRARWGVRRARGEVDA